MEHVLLGSLVARQGGQGTHVPAKGSSLDHVDGALDHHIDFTTRAHRVTWSRQVT